MTAKKIDPEEALAAVEAYLANVPEPFRATLEKLRATVRSSAPKQAIEYISYGMPAFHYKGPLVGYAAFKEHCSFFPMGSGAIEQFDKELAGFRISKGTIQFTIEKPLPAALVKKMVKACVERNEGKASK